MKYSQRVDREGEKSMASIIGIVFSIILFIIVLGYAIFKLEILLMQSDVKYVLT